MKQMRSLRWLSLLLALLLVLSGCIDTPKEPEGDGDGQNNPSQSFDLASLPAYSGIPYAVLYNNVPSFTQDQYTTVSYEQYAQQDALGRCGVAIACVGRDLMPTEERGDISSVKPTGWHSVQHGGQYLYNRCHLIGFQLSGENANERNLITGTRYFNVEGMLPFENQVADYVKETGNHVLLRVTPIYNGNDLVARGVQMEAFSVEDGGADVCFNVFVYNVQPGITIDYATGASWQSGEAPNTGAQNGAEAQEYVLNTSTKRFHYPHCSGVSDMNPANRQTVTATRDSLLSQNYVPCGICRP